MGEITWIYDLGPDIENRYTIVSGQHDIQNNIWNALVIGDKADKGRTRPHWIKVDVMHDSDLGKEITYERLPPALRNYLQRNGFDPLDPYQFTLEDIERLADESAEHLYKEYPFERNSIMRAAFEIFQVEIISRAHQETLKK